MPERSDTDNSDASRPADDVGISIPTRSAGPFLTARQPYRQDTGGSSTSVNTQATDSSTRPLVANAPKRQIYKNNPLVVTAFLAQELSKGAGATAVGEYLGNYSGEAALKYFQEHPQIARGVAFAGGLVVASLAANYFYVHTKNIAQYAGHSKKAAEGLGIAAGGITFFSTAGLMGAYAAADPQGAAVFTAGVIDVLTTATLREGVYEAVRGAGLTLVGPGGRPLENTFLKSLISNGVYWGLSTLGNGVGVHQAIDLQNLDNKNSLLQAGDVLSSVSRFKAGMAIIVESVDEVNPHIVNMVAEFAKGNGVNIEWNGWTNYKNAHLADFDDDGNLTKSGVKKFWENFFEKFQRRAVAGGTLGLPMIAALGENMVSAVTALYYQAGCAGPLARWRGYITELKNRGRDGLEYNPSQNILPRTTSDTDIQLHVFRPPPSPNRQGTEDSDISITGAMTLAHRSILDQSREIPDPDQYITQTTILSPNTNRLTQEPQLTIGSSNGTESPRSESPKRSLQPDLKTSAASKFTPTDHFRPPAPPSQIPSPPVQQKIRSTLPTPLGNSENASLENRPPSPPKQQDLLAPPLPGSHVEAATQAFGVRTVGSKPFPEETASQPSSPRTAPDPAAPPPEAVHADEQTALPETTPPTRPRPETLSDDPAARAVQKTHQRTHDLQNKTDQQIEDYYREAGITIRPTPPGTRPQGLVVADSMERTLYCEFPRENPGETLVFKAPKDERPPIKADLGKVLPQNFKTQMSDKQRRVQTSERVVAPSQNSPAGEQPNRGKKR